MKRCSQRALSPIRSRESHRPALPVHRVLYLVRVTGVPLINFLNILSVGALTVVNGKLFHSFIVDGMKDLPVDTNHNF